MKEKMIKAVKKRLAKALVIMLVATTMAPLATTYAASYTASPVAQEAYQASDKTYMPSKVVNANFKVVLNGSPIDLGVQIKVVSGSTMLPLRATAKALGINNSDIGWDGNYKTAMVSQGGNRVEVVRGSSKAIVNGAYNSKDLAQKMYIDSKGTSYLPLRSVGELLNCKIDWDGNTKTISITTNFTQPTQTEYMSNYLKNEYGMTDAQVAETLNRIHVFDGEHNDYATKEQYAHYKKWYDYALEHAELQQQPTKPGNYKGEVQGVFVYDGESWSVDIDLFTGMKGGATRFQLKRLDYKIV